MCPVVSRFDAKRRREWSQEVLSDGIRFPTRPLQEAVNGPPAETGTRLPAWRTLTAGARSWVVSRQANPLRDVRFGAIIDGSSRAGATSTPVLLCTNRGGEPIGSDADIHQGRHGMDEPCRSEGLYRFSSQVSADFAIACVVEKTRESVEAAGCIVLDMALSIWTC